MTKNECRRSLGIIKGNLRNAIDLTMKIVDDCNSAANGVIDMKSLDIIITEYEKIIGMHGQLLGSLYEIKEKISNQ